MVFPPSIQERSGHTSIQPRLGCNQRASNQSANLGLLITLSVERSEGEHSCGSQVPQRSDCRFPSVIRPQCPSEIGERRLWELVAERAIIYFVPDAASKLTWRKRQ